MQISKVKFIFIIKTSTSLWVLIDLASYFKYLAIHDIIFTLLFVLCINFTGWSLNFVI